MTNTFAIYLLTRLTAVQGLFVALAIISGLLIVGYSIHYFSLYDFHDTPDTAKVKSAKKGVKTWSIFSIVFCLFSIMTPTTNEAIVIVAGGKTLDYVQKDTSLQKIPYKATELILHKMDEYPKEDKGGNNEQQ